MWTRSTTKVLNQLFSRRVVKIIQNVDPVEAALKVGMIGGAMIGGGAGKSQAIDINSNKVGTAALVTAGTIVGGGAGLLTSGLAVFSFSKAPFFTALMVASGIAGSSLVKEDVKPRSPR